MVSINSLATGLLALAASSAIALPADVSPANSAAEIEARQTGPARVYFCEHTYWTGACQEFSGDWFVCHNLPSAWNDRASSVKAITYSNYLRCRWYEHGNCQGEVYDNQEDANLADGSGFFNDRISSWKCN